MSTRLWIRRPETSPGDIESISLAPASDPAKRSKITAQIHINRLRREDHCKWGPRPPPPTPGIMPEEPLSLPYEAHFPLLYHSLLSLHFSYLRFYFLKYYKIPFSNLDLFLGEENFPVTLLKFFGAFQIINNLTSSFTNVFSWPIHKYVLYCGEKTFKNESSILDFIADSWCDLGKVNLFLRCTLHIFRSLRPWHSF